MQTNMWALYAREVKRFQKIWIDTVFNPIVSVALYLGVFGIVTSGRTIGSLPYLTFVYTGLLAMLVVNNSFSNPSFALVIAKNVGNIIDLQLVPIPVWRIGIAYSLAAFTRGVVTLLIALFATVWFIPGLGFPAHPLYFLIGLFMTGLEFGMLGVAFGFWAKNFEALTFMNVFVMQPMIFLAGVFYPVATLPKPWNAISLFNPIHHNINFFRYSFTGYSDLNPLVSLLVIFGFSVIFFTIMQLVAKRNIVIK
ncbi:MAG TPA: ABC transporter permease [Candidatus Udaeobacter sp.]|nr:ABC transporter permease [Candidatus Udaeobacter sp.]